MCHQLRVLNSVRHVSIGIPITFRQYPMEKCSYNNRYYNYVGVAYGLLDLGYNSLILLIGTTEFPLEF